MDVQIEASWKEVLKEEFDKSYFAEIAMFLKHEKALGKAIYPPGNLIFNAFNTTPFDKVKVVILGQDPYHGPRQAHGLCFSVQDDVPPPPSLINIFKELREDLGLPIPATGNLSKWAEHGVLLLNAILTVRAAEAASHSKIGWETFTDAVIRKLSTEKTHIVFLLWGSFAIQKQQLIDRNKHAVFTSAHPSPLSAHRGFLTCKHVSKANAYLSAHGLSPVDWRV